MATDIGMTPTQPLQPTFVLPDPGETFWQHYWPHLTAAIGSLIAIALGSADHFFLKDGWGVGVDLSFIWAGLGSLGITATSVVASTKTV